MRTLSFLLVGFVTLLINSCSAPIMEQAAEQPAPQAVQASQNPQCPPLEWSSVFSKKPVILDVPPTLKEGVTQKIIARPNSEFIKGLKDQANLSPDFSCKAAYQTIYFEIQLSGDNFNIKPLVANKQIVVADVTNWVWSITPTNSGSLELTMNASIYVRSGIQSGSEEAGPSALIQAPVVVEPNPAYHRSILMHQFLSFLFTAAGIGIVGLILNQIIIPLWKERRKAPVGSS